MLDALIIVFREVIEAGLIVGIMMAATRGVPHAMRWIAAGVVGGLAGAGLMAVFAERIAVLKNGSLSMLGTPEEVFSRGSELLEMGLNLPQATRLVRALRERGVEIARDYYRMDELKNELIGRWRYER